MRSREQFVLLDNLFCDGEVSVDGHSWSNSAYATDFNEKLWPVTYGGQSKATPSAANVPGGGHMWDLARRKGLTFRSYGEYAARVERRHHHGRIPQRHRTATGTSRPASSSRACATPTT